MRLKVVLHCVQCHLVLLILIGFAAGGYLLREELGTFLGWPGMGKPPQPVAAPDRQGAGDRLLAASSPTVAPQALRPGLRSESPGDLSTAGRVSTSGVVVAGRDRLDVSQSLTPGEFRFRPMDDAMSTDSPGVDAERRSEMLAVARRAYWNHDIALAIKHYQALTQAYPNDPDFYGEMGNIYYEQGEHELAAQAYHEAGLLLLGRGQRTRARELADLVQKIAPDSARDLLERLQGTRYLR